MKDQLNKKPLSVLSRCSKLSYNTGLARAEARSRMLDSRQRGSSDIKMKNVTVVVNEHKILRKRAGSAVKTNNYSPGLTKPSSGNFP